MSIPDTVFTLAKAKEHLRVVHALDDALITRMLDGAVAECERITRRAWTVRTWEVALDACHLDGCESEVFHAELSPATAEVFTVPVGGGTPVQVPPADVVTHVKYGHTWISVAAWPAVADAGVVGSIKYTAKPMSDVVPPDVYAAAMLYLGAAYENREAFLAGVTLGPNPQAEMLLAPYVIEMHV